MTGEWTDWEQSGRMVGPATAPRKSEMLDCKAWRHSTFGFSFWIAAHPGFASEPVCQVVFARYAHTPTPYLAYGAFYWVGLLGMVLLAGHGATYSADPHDRRLSTQLLIGSLAFILPSLLTSWVFRIPEGAFASIMCHYALLLAVFLARLLYLERRSLPAEERLPVEE